MSTTPARHLLIELLQALAGRSMTFGELTARFGSGTHRVSAALEALEGEGLVSVEVRERGSVYAATPAGRDALAARSARADVAEGPVAVMFTDLVSSSELIESLGELEAHLVHRRHFFLLREAITRHCGHEVKNLGDGLMVVFDEPAAALDCARAMQRAIARDGDGLSLRVGIDVGEPLREGDDYFGTTVIVARRLCDAAAAGEILVSDRLRGPLGELGRLQSRGLVTLKGFTQPVAISVASV
jgi:class 3 adenylate cyclase